MGDTPCPVKLLDCLGTVTIREHRVPLSRKLLGVEQLQVCDVAWEEADDRQVLVVSVRATKGARSRCSRCRRRRPGYNQGGGTRRWRALDHGSTMVFLQAAAPRVNCQRHGVVVAAVPWARPGARATRAFKQVRGWRRTPPPRWWRS